MSKSLKGPKVSAHKSVNMNKRFTPPKTHIEPTNWWCVDVSPFPRGYFQVPCWFSGVYWEWESCNLMCTVCFGMVSPGLFVMWLDTICKYVYMLSTYK